MNTTTIVCGLTTEQSQQLFLTYVYVIFSFTVFGLTMVLKLIGSCLK